ncbi:hypothetical protein BDR04DRAFT_1153464 [Suillus decipiens]|nr:hypothetical protein BDR04DRAFT_1153464 [Suillus decipiens]
MAEAATLLWLAATSYDLCWGEEPPQPTSHASLPSTAGQYEMCWDDRPATPAVEYQGGFDMCWGDFSAGDGLHAVHPTTLTNPPLVGSGWLVPLVALSEGLVIAIARVEAGEELVIQADERLHRMDEMMKGNQSPTASALIEANQGLISREAKILALKMDTELLKQHKEKYQQWFHNHKKVQANFKAPSKLQKKWMACQVIEEERKAEILQQICKEIEEETGQKAAHKEVLRRYQLTMTAFMLWLDKKELQEAQAKAERWTNQVPNATVQAKTARKKGEKMVKSFAKDMYIQAGMRIFILDSWKDEKGRLLTSEFDFNEQLSKGSSFIKYKDWQVILPSWEDFISDAFDQDKDQDVTLHGGTHQVPKPYHEFDLDHLGLLMFLKINGLPLETKKAMIWSFLTIYYSKPIDQHR